LIAAGTAGAQDWVLTTDYKEVSETRGDETETQTVKINSWCDGGKPSKTNPADAAKTTSPAPAPAPDSMAPAPESSAERAVVSTATMVVLVAAFFN
jgi:hypothetical protein